MQPIYRLTVYAPRSISATETTVLTPASGAPHSDQFIVTSAQGIAGAKPYLALPSSRGGTIDALNKKTTIGALTVKLLDARVTPGGGNAARWVTAFIGDGSGGNMLLGRLAKVEQSVDGGTHWAPYFTGRISGPALEGKLWIQLALKDVADDLALDVFVGAPHPNTSAYAALAQVAPIGLLQPVRSAATSTSPGTGYAGLSLTTPLRAKTNAPNGPAFTFDVDHSVGDPYRTIVTQALLAASNKALARAYDNTTAGRAAPRPVVMISAAGAGVYHAFDLELVPLNVGNPKQGNTQYWKTSIEGVQARQQAVAGSQAPPSAGTSIDFYILDSSVAPTDRVPLLIDDVNPVTFAQHLCAGYFGRLDASGAPFRSVPFSANGIDGTKVPPYRTIVRKASKLNAELEALCRQYHWAYYVDAGGSVTLVDLHRSSVTAAAVTLTDADLESSASALAWQQDRESAMTSFFGSYYPERRMSVGSLPKPFDKVTSAGDLPDVPTVFLEELPSVAALIAELGPRSADMKPQTLEVDAKGFRYLSDGSTTTEHLPTSATDPASLRANVLRGYLQAYWDEIQGPFGLGPSYIDLVCRRASANINDPTTGAPLATPGKYASLTFTALPDPATNQRGGPRLGLIVSRTDDGPRVKLRVLDAGANAVALAPTFGTPTLASGVITLPVTLNALSEPVRVSYAVTATSVAVAPAVDDPNWIAGPLVTVTGNATIGNLPGGGRVWLRARSLSGSGAGFKLPSAWVAPTPTHLDLTVLAAPSGVTVTGATLDALAAAWTNGDATLGVDIFLAAGATVTATDDTRLAPMLPAGTLQYALPPLTGGATYTVGVRAHDTSGGVSTLVTYTFVATAATRTLATPSNPTGFSGSQDPRYGFPQQDGVYGLAVAASEFPGATEFTEQVETAANSGVYGAAATISRVANVQGDWTLFERVAPNDGLRRLLAARQVRDGATASAYTPSITVLPWTSQTLGKFSDVVGPSQVLRVSYEESTDGTTRNFIITVGALVDTVHVHYRLVPINQTGDVFDFSGAEAVSVSPSLIIVRPSSGVATFSLTHPPRGFMIAARLVPHSAPPQLTPGPSWPLAVEAAPPAVNGKIHPLRIVTTADLSIDIAFGVSDGPVTVDVIEDQAAVSTTILTKTMAAVGTIDKVSDPVLGGRVLPAGKDSLLWRVRITDVSGQAYWFGPAMANRDPLPYGTVTVSNYKATPAFVSAFDPDVDSIRITMASGKTKTYNAAALLAAGSPVVFSIGDLLDDSTTEAAFAVDETRTGYKVEYQGGGQWVTIWQGDLHGQPSTPQFSVQLLANTPDATHDRIVWSCTQGTALVSIDGGAFGTPSASPFDVAKPATGRHTYVFQFTNGGLAATDEVDVLPVSADTITPNLDVALGTPTASTMPYTATAANPVSGGAAPTITVKCVGCTMTISGTTYPDGTTQTITSPTVVTGNKAASSSTTNGNLEFVATLGNATERIVVPVPPQSPIGGVGNVQVSRNTPDSSHDRFTWSATRGTMTVSVDGGSYTTPSASPWDVLNTSQHTYDWLLTAADGSTTPWHFDVGLPASGPPPLVTNCRVTAQSTTADTITVQWDTANVPSGATFNLLWSTDNHLTITTIVGVSTPYTHNKAGTGGHGFDITNGGTISPMGYEVQMLAAGGALLAASNWYDTTVDHV